jgi:hypothetical protein
VTATWSGIATPTWNDWIGLYAVGTTNTAEITWIYLSCTQGVGAVRDSGSCAFQLPSSLTPGSYELRLFARDGYTLQRIHRNALGFVGGRELPGPRCWFASRMSYLRPKGASNDAAPLVPG